MKHKGLIILGLFLMTGLINAQTDFRPGYVIKTNGDTLIGEIDYRGDLLMGEICRFKNKDIDKEIKYYPGDIAGYRFNESKYYISKEVSGKKVFLEFLIKGKVNIYYIRDDKGEHYFIEKEGIGLTEIPYEERIMYIDNEPNKQYLVQSTKHIGILNVYMQDAPEFQSRIKNIGIPEHESLIRLAEDYHNKVCKDGACIIYEKKLPLLKLHIEFTGGTVNCQNIDNVKDKNYFQAGILTHFWMPRTNENLFFRTGLLYSTLESNDEKKVIYKIPIQIEYVYPKFIISPKFAFGINVYNPFYQSVSLMGGLNIKLHKSVYLGINYDIDFIPTERFPLFPKSILTQSILTGILIKL